MKQQESEACDRKTKSEHWAEGEWKAYKQDATASNILTVPHTLKSPHKLKVVLNNFKGITQSYAQCNLSEPQHK